MVEKRSYSRNSGSTSLDSEMWRSRERFPYRFAHLLLVLGVQEREQQADRDGVDLRLPQRVDGLLQAVLVERLELALGPHPLLHREAQISRHQRLRAPLGEVVERRAVLAGELDQVAEALRS